MRLGCAHPWRYHQPHSTVLKQYERQGNNPQLSVCPDNERGQHPGAEQLSRLGPHRDASLFSTASPSYSHLNPKPQDTRTQRGKGTHKAQLWEIIDIHLLFYRIFVSLNYHRVIRLNELPCAHNEWVLMRAVSARVFCCTVT